MAKRWFTNRLFLMSASIILLVLIGIFHVQTTPDTNRENWPKQFTSDGQRLYFTGQTASGQHMAPRGGHHHMTMMGNGACVDCHGTDREGGRLWPTFWHVAPAVTFSALAGDHGHGGHDHDTYDAESLAGAITEGIRPDGSTIGLRMPRWSMTPQSLDHLVNYLLLPPDSD